MRRSVVASMLATVVLLSIIAPAAAAPTDEAITVTLQPTADSYDAGETYEMALVVENTSDAVGAYDITLEANDQLSIVAYEPTNLLGEFGSISISSDGTTAALVAANAGVDSVDGVATLGTLTVQTEANGTGSITPDVATLTNESGAQYTNSSVRALSISIGSESTSFAALPGAQGPPTSVDDDPLLEDLNGDGTAGLFDALFYYNNRNSDTVTNNPTEFDFDGDGTAGTLFDTLALYNKITTGPETPSFGAFPGAQGPPTSVDDDPLLEDIDGDGTAGLFDALAYYNNRNSDTITNNPTQFDFDGDGTAGTLFDALALYNEISA